MIARIISGNIFPCPRQGYANGTYHTNLPRYYGNHPEAAAEDGYYPVRYTDAPDGDYLPSWSLQEDGGALRIVQGWAPYTPQPEPEDPVAARLEMIEECLLELSGVLYA